MAVKERPILFSGEMVRAILEGRKTQTRRVVKPQPSEMSVWHGAIYEGEIDLKKTPCMESRSCPYGIPGNRLWVQETFCTCTDEQRLDEGFVPSIQTCFHADGKARCDPDEMTWTPSIHMPRIASRITLEITGVRVERVQDISPHDALSEGIVEHPAIVGNKPSGFHIDAFRILWDSLPKPGAKWDDNPWVWVIEFKRVENA